MVVFKPIFVFMLLLVCTLPLLLSSCGVCGVVVGAVAVSATNLAHLGSSLNNKNIGGNLGSYKIPKGVYLSDLKS